MGNVALDLSLPLSLTAMKKDILPLLMPHYELCVRYVAVYNTASFCTNSLETFATVWIVNRVTMASSILDDISQTGASPIMFLKIILEAEMM